MLVKLRGGSVDQEENKEPSVSEGIGKGVQAGKEAAKKAKKAGQSFKAFITRMAKDPVYRWAVIILAGVALLLILIAGFYYIIKGDLSDNTTSAVSNATSVSSETQNPETGEIIPPTIATNIEQDENGVYHYKLNYNIDEADKKRVDSYLQQKGIQGLSEATKDFIVALVKHGYNIEDYGQDKENLEALFLFFKAELASQSLDLRNESQRSLEGATIPELSVNDNKVQGIVRLERGNPTETIAITYLPKEKFNEELDEVKKNYFTIDENNNLLLSTFTKTTTSYTFENAPEGIPVPDTTETSEIHFINGDSGIAYKDEISKYSMPFELLQILLTYLEDKDFCKNLAQSVCQSEIILTVQEEPTIVTTTEQITRTTIKELYYDLEGTLIGNIPASNEILVEKEGTLQDVQKLKSDYHCNTAGIPLPEGNGMLFSWKYNGDDYNLSYTINANGKYDILLTRKKAQQGGSIDVKEKPLNFDVNTPYTARIEEDSFEITKTTTSEYSNYDFKVKKIKNWFIEIELEDAEGSGYTTETENGNLQISDEPATEEEIEESETLDYTAFPSIELSSDQIKEDININRYKDEIEDENGWSSSSWKDDTKSTKYTNQYVEDVVTESSFNQTSYIKTEETQAVKIRERKEDGSFEDGSFLDYYDQSEEAKYLMSSADLMIFEKMEEHNETVPLVDVIKTLLYSYTQNQAYKVEDFDLSEFYAPNFIVSIKKGELGQEYTKAWQNISLWKYINDEVEYSSVAQYISEDKTKIYEYKIDGESYFGYGIHGSYFQEEINEEDGKKYVDVDTANDKFSEIYRNIKANMLEAATQAEVDDLTYNKKVVFIDKGFETAAKTKDASLNINWEDFFKNTYGNIDAVKVFINNNTTTTRGSSRVNIIEYEKYYIPGNTILDKDEYYGGEPILDVAEKLWKRVCAEDPEYGRMPSIPPGASIEKVDCSSFVEWILREYGLDLDNVEDKLTSLGFYKTDWETKFGFEEIKFSERENIIEKVQPGDIVVRRGENLGHVTIVHHVDYNEELVYVYDCGDDDLWCNCNGEPIVVNNSKFFKGQGNSEQTTAHGKIIRIPE